MTGLPWYKCDPVAFNDGMIGLSRSERGVYVTVLNKIYAEGGPAPDNAIYWAGVFGCTEAQWVKDRDALIRKGKLYETCVEGGVVALMNRRAGAVLDEQLRFKSEQAERGAKGGSATRKKPRRNNELSRVKRPLSKRLASAKEIERETETKIQIPPTIQEDITRSQEEAQTAKVIPLDGRGRR